MAKHNFPEYWWKVEKKVRFITKYGELWNCEIGKVVAYVGRPVQLGEID